MFYILCPHCGKRQEIPADAVGADRTDLYNVVSCLNCGASFDFNDDCQSALKTSQ